MSERRPAAPQPPLAVSACLLGLPCRYDGMSKGSQEVLDACRGNTVIPMCPEVAAGYGVPRPSITQDASRPLAEAPIIREDGVDVTEALDRAIALLLEVVDDQGVTCAFLKEGSPSCGVNRTYHGPHKVLGGGRFARALVTRGVTITSEEDLRVEEHAL